MSNRSAVLGALLQTLSLGAAPAEPTLVIVNGRLAEGVRRMTPLPASVLKLADRGRIAPGMKADLVLFDPETVTDRSTPKDPWAAPAGIPWVLVNGQVVVENSTPTDARPGRALRAQR